VDSPAAAHPDSPDVALRRPGPAATNPPAGGASSTSSTTTRPTRVEEAYHATLPLSKPPLLLARSVAGRGGRHRVCVLRVAPLLGADLRLSLKKKRPATSSPICSALSACLCGEVGSWTCGACSKEGGSYDCAMGEVGCILQQGMQQLLDPLQ
jgi:hypothetical protein